MTANNSSVATFEQKLLSAQPELEVIGVFLPPPQRTLLAVYGCLVHELEQAAFSIREPQVAAGKLQWWEEELARAMVGLAQHPITRALFAIQGVSNQPASIWQTLPRGALAQLNCGTASDLSTQLLQMSHFYTPVTCLEMALLGAANSTAVAEPIKKSVDTSAAARVVACTQLFQYVKKFIVTKIPEASLFPLNLLARHHKITADFTQPLTLWREVFNDYLDELSTVIKADLSIAESLSVPRRVQARFALAEIRHWRVASNPERLIGKKNFQGLWGCVWYAWREAKMARFKANV